MPFILDAAARRIRGFRAARRMTNSRQRLKTELCGVTLAAVDCNIQAWPLAHHRPAHAVADLGSVHIQLREGAAQRVAMHAELGRGLALIALVMGKDFEDVALLELPDRIRIGNAGTVHLRY